jgi:hypothetical protein
MNKMEKMKNRTGEKKQKDTSNSKKKESDYGSANQ